MKHLLSLILILSSTLVYAIDEPITGIVRDAENNKPLAFASIVISGQTSGTVSNIDGQFVLDSRLIDSQDSILFSYIGYKTLKVPYSTLIENTDIYLEPSILNLKDVKVYSKALKADDLIELIKDNFETNYPKFNGKQDLFLHKYDLVPFPDQNKISITSSDFEGLDPATFEALMAKMPKEFIEYHDAVLELYTQGDEHKLKPIEALSLEEHSMEDIAKEMESLLTDFFEDIEKSKKNEDVYYKFRSGIFAAKIDDEQGGENDSIWKDQMKDSLNYLIHSEQIKGSVLWLFKDYGHLEGKNWEFLEDDGKYKYEIENVTMYDNEVVYVVTFKPKNRGLFSGTMYVSTDSYAVLQVDFEYAPEKDDENFNMLGIGHSMKYKRGKVIFEKRETGYFIKYINAHQHEIGSVDRNFSIMKKEKRFLWDKELNEIKFDVNLSFEDKVYWEVLVKDRTGISEEQFEKIEQPLYVKFKKQYTYKEDMWSNNSVIAPSTELKEYKRK
ncbi:MAG: DUF5686 and carboxypeptidase regulatory-like domain-containing protein [Reichenbachiella sp.]